MGKEFDLARTAAQGVFHLLIGKILSRAIGVIGGLFLIRLLGPSGYGLLAVAVVAPGVFSLFSDLGTSAAVTKYLAEFRSKGALNLKPLLYSGLGFRVTLSSALTVLSFLTADAFASLIGKPEVAPLIRVASLLVLGWTLYSLSGAFLVGLDATKAYAALMFLHESLGVLLPVMLVIYGMDVFGALLGMALSTTIGGLVGISIALLIVTKKRADKSETFRSDLPLRKMLRYGMPLGAADFINTGVAQYHGFMIATFCVAYEIGSYNVALGVLAAIVYLTFPISTVMFPAFSKINAETEQFVLEKVFKYSVKYSSFLILPAAGFLMIFARPVTVLLFGAEFGNAWIYLALLALGQLSYGLGGPHLKRLLMAQGETAFAAKLEALTAVFGVLLGLILIPTYGISGLILTILVVDWPSYLWAVRKVNKQYGVKPPFTEVSKLYVSLLIMIVILVPIASIPINEVFKIILGVSLSLVGFFAAALITRAIEANDVNILRDIFEPQPIIGAVANKVLKILSRMTKSRSA